MEIPNPRRILILSAPSTNLDTLIQALTTPAPSTAPLPTSPTPTPSSPLHHHISTPYYRATIPIWTDHVPSPAAFHAEWLALPGASAVVAAIGAWVVAFHKPSSATELQATQTLLATIAALLTHHLSASFAATEPPALFAVALPHHQLPRLALDAAAWEDLCRESGGWEFVDGAEGGGAEEGARNEFGETTGLPRLLEGLQAVEWDAADAAEGWEEEEEEEEMGALEGWEEGGMREPMIAGDDGADGPEGKTGGGDAEGGSGVEGLGGEGLSGDDDDDDGADREVQALQHMLLKMQAVKELGADLPEGERRKLAAQAVREVMRGV
ncbi:hypothetical protein MMC27_002577 [Xylographa pallens]|nr:hypothetical protein [Xylographa pallens]